MSVAAVVVAGGRGARMGGPVRKQYLEVGGVPVLLRALRPFLSHPRVAVVAVVLPAEDAAAPPPWLAELPVIRVAGGAERADSVRNGLAALPAGIETVLIHDGARPFVDAAIIDRVVDGARDGGAIAAVPVSDTIKQVAPDGRVTATPDRAALWRAQTPQGFPMDALVRAYRAAQAAGAPAPDDAAVFERFGGMVRVVPGDERNLKVTHPSDLIVAEALAARPALP